LRAAIRSESTGEYERASNFFQQAYDLALDLYKTDEGSNDSKGQELIKLSGIAVRWGGMWETSGQIDKAVEVYDVGFQPIADYLDRQKFGKGGDYETVKRGAGLALKLGDLWTVLGGSTPSLTKEAQSEAERYYTWAVEELMRLSLTGEQKEKVKREMENQERGIANAPAEEEKKKQGEEDKGMELPGWIGEVELVAAFERLGDLYSRQGRIE
jgi:hypothetical protein